MRLLHSREWRFREFFDDAPPYVILSHRWGQDEISYQALQLAIKEQTTPNVLNLSGEGFQKIENCRKHVADLYNWVWIDTCCINKDSSAELSEAINSMYRYYYRAKACYIYLSDLEDITNVSAFQKPWDSEEQDDSRLLKLARERAMEQFRASQWFTRGWTLQELLAPSRAFFYDSSWHLFNTRDNLAEVISTITGIQVDLLRGGSGGGGWASRRHERIAHTSAAKKMSWLAGRRTSRVEDMAYCMLGLFNVNMPLLYGEGGKAFLRLQWEIISKTDDESIFAWGLGMGISRAGGMLADNPSLFANSGAVENYAASERPVYRRPYYTTNQGLRFDVETTQANQIMTEPGGGSSFRLELNCYQRGGQIGGTRLQVVVDLEHGTDYLSQQWTRMQCRLFQAATFPGRSATRITIFVRQAYDYLDLPASETTLDV